MEKQKPEKQINVRIPEELHREVKAEAVREGKSLSQLIADLLTGWLHGPKTKEGDEPKQ